MTIVSHNNIYMSKFLVYSLWCQLLWQCPKFGTSRTRMPWSGRCILHCFLTKGAGWSPKSDPFLKQMLLGYELHKQILHRTVYHLPSPALLTICREDRFRKDNQKRNEIVPHLQQTVASQALRKHLWNTFQCRGTLSNYFVMQSRRTYSSWTW